MTTTNIPEMKAASSRFRRTLETIDKATQPERLQGFLRLKWPFKKEENARLIAEIERCKSGFSLGMNIEQAYFPVTSILNNQPENKTTSGRCLKYESSHGR